MGSDRPKCSFSRSPILLRNPSILRKSAILGDMTFDPSELSEEDREEILAQTEVTAAAWKFLTSFYGGDLVSAWEVLDPTLRLCLAQWWTEANRKSFQDAGYSPEKVAIALAQSAPTEHELWEHFERVLLRDLRKAYPLDVASAGIGASPRLIALDTELLYVHPEVPTDGLWKPDEARVAYPLVMRLTDNHWNVLNWGSDTIPTPGHPPILHS